jgi:hypothetical protein
MLLILDGADGGADNEGFPELSLVGAGEVREKVGGPGAAVTAVVGQSGIYGKCSGFRYAD